MSLAAADREAVRAMVRDALRELLPAMAARPAPAAAAPLPPSPPPAAQAAPPNGRVATRGEPRVAPRIEEVSLTSDAELSAFVTRLLDRAADVRAGLLQFRLRTATPYGTPTAGRHLRVDKGAVTEAMVNRAAKEGVALLLARRVVATPLALDRARDLGVRIERER